MNGFLARPLPLVQTLSPNSNPRAPSPHPNAGTQVSQAVPPLIRAEEVVEQWRGFADGRPRVSEKWLSNAVRVLGSMLTIRVLRGH